MGEKDIYIESLSQQLEQWKAEIFELELKAENAGDAIQDKCETALHALKDYYDATEASVEGWIESAADTWNVLEEKADQKMEVATAAMKSAINHLRMILG